MQPSEDTWRAIDADGNARTVEEGKPRPAPVALTAKAYVYIDEFCGEPDLTEQSRRARVMALWAEGKDTFTIGELLGLPEHEVCRILRDGRELSRQP